MGKRVELITYREDKSLRQGLRLFKNDNSVNWYFQVYITESTDSGHFGKYVTRTCKTDDFKKAKKYSISEYDKLMLKKNEGYNIIRITFKQVSEEFWKWYSRKDRTDKQKRYTEMKLKVLNQYFGHRDMRSIKTDTTEDYMKWRKDKYKKEHRGRVLSNKTIHQDFITWRSVMNFSLDKHYISKEIKIVKYHRRGEPRSGFELQDWKTIQTHIKEKIDSFSNKETEDDFQTQEMKTEQKWKYEQLLDYLLFLFHSGLRIDECLGLRKRDVRILKEVKDEDGKKTRGVFITVTKSKTSRFGGKRECVGKWGCVTSYQRLVKRNKLNDDDYLFSRLDKKTGKRKVVNLGSLFGKVLEDTNLRRDRQNNLRDTKSCRVSYINWELLQHRNIYEVAKNCGTSVKIIEKWYDSKISSIRNVRSILTFKKNFYTTFE